MVQQNSPYYFLNLIIPSPLKTLHILCSFFNPKHSLFITNSSRKYSQTLHGYDFPQTYVVPFSLTSNQHLRHCVVSCMVNFLCVYPMTTKPTSHISPICFYCMLQIYDVCADPFRSLSQNIFFRLALLTSFLPFLCKFV